MKPPPSYTGISAHRKRLGRSMGKPKMPPMDRPAKRGISPEHFVGMPHEEAHEHLTGAGYAHHPVFEDHHHYHHMGKKHSIHLRIHDTGEVGDAMGHDLGDSGGMGGQY